VLVADLRLTISLSGGASLGAYQAGASAALLVALDHLRTEHGLDVRVDAVGGASAGAIVGLMVAFALLEGVDGSDVMHEAWVERVSIDTLLRRGSRGALSLEDVRRELPDLLAGGRRAGRRQDHPLVLHVALTGLRGLTYDIPGLRREQPVLGVSYADWKDFRLEPGAGVEQLLEPEGSSPLETVMASASHPGAFAPRVLDRRGDRQDYEGQGLSNLPRSGWLWYTDGGLVQHEPIGRLLSAAQRVDDGGDGARRLTLMVHPRSKEPSDAEQWSDRDHEASWAEGLSRGLAVVSEQPLYDDLRKVARDNARLAWAERLAATLEPELGDGAREGVEALLREIEESSRERRGGSGDEALEPPADAPFGELLRRALADVGGLTGKRTQDVDLISPLLIAARTDEDVSSLLAGELLGDFGGFLDRELRESDFALGYESALCWTQEGLRECGLPEPAVGGAADAVQSSRPVAWETVREGEMKERDLPWRARLRLAHFLLRAARSLLRS
jgi:predicted acylesterase/phospholipase RssA